MTRRRCGRRPIADVAASVAIYVRVTPGQRTRLEELARTNLTTVAALIRDAVDALAADCSDQRVFPPRA